LRHSGSIKNRLTGIILLVTSLTGLIGYSSFLFWNVAHQHERVLGLAQTVGNIISQDVAKIILLKDVSAAADITSSLRSFPGLRSMVLYNLTQEPVYQYSLNDETFTVQELPAESDKHIWVEGDMARLYIDVVYQDNHLGYTALTFRIMTIWEMILRDRIVIFVIALSMFILSYLLATFYAKRFIGPILRLVSFLEKITYLGALRERISTTEKNEYGKLYDEVNTMLERLELAQEAQKLAAVAFETQSGMTITNAEQVILKVNKAFTEITGYTPDDALGKTPAILKSGRHGDEFYKDMFKSLKEHHYWSGEIYNRHKDGTIFPEYLTIQAVLDTSGEIIYYVASFVDLTTQKESEAKLEYLQNYDPLTGLFKRERLTTRIQQYLEDKPAQGWGVLVCFDLNEFKLINEAYGHGYGDELLQQVTERVQKEFDDADLIARIGGDEFAMWYRIIDTNRDQASIHAKLLAEFLITVLTKPYQVHCKTIHAIPTIGITLYEQHDMDADRLLKQADSALHHAKQKGNNFAFFDKQSEKMTLAHLNMYSQLLRASEQQQFELYYQPQHDVHGGICSMEALIRWQHPENGLISPMEFIPLAERTGQIIPIGLWVIEEACDRLSSWQQDALTADLTLSVNISPKQFIQDEFVDLVEQTIYKYGIKPKSLKFELTESILVDEVSKVHDKMQKLRDLGIQLSLDDFGTGYSSLGYLRNLPLDQIKIDQSFVKGMLTNQSDIAIIKSVLQLGESLQLEVIAEGVETEEHYNVLKSLGCTYFQGYYFSHPQPVGSIVGLKKK
jgi:diguanylate cyclase (GGDEF)-like protein/PAS domain S-box-containing protein